MTDKILKHYGVMGMRWGRRGGSSGASSSTSQPTSHKLGLRGMLDKHHMDQRVSSYDPEKIKQSRIRVLKLMALGYGAIAVSNAVAHLMKHPITVTVNWTKFKKLPEPFYKVTIGKAVQRKLLPGG